MAEKGSEFTKSELKEQAERLRQQLAAREAELSVINRIQEGIASNLPLEDIFELVGERIAEIFAGHSVAIFLFNPDTGMAEPKFMLERGVRHQSPPIEPGPIGKRVVQTREPLMISTRAEFQELGAKIIEGTAASLSGIYSPLLLDQEVIGALNIENADQENAFSESDLRLVTTIANSLSVALENARLFDELQSANRALTQTLNRESAISGILRVMANSPSEIEPVLQAVAQHATELTEADDVQVYHVDGDRLRQAAHAGSLPSLEKGETLPLVPELITGRAVLERRTIHIQDAADVPQDEYPVSSELQKRLHHRSVIATPLVREGSAIGAIVARRNEVRPFTGKQIQLLATFADQAAIAIENVRLFDETQRLLQQTEERAAELAIINTVQQSLVAEMDIDSIYEAVGKQLKTIFESQVVAIASVDLDRRQMTTKYVYEKGRELDPQVRAFNSLYEDMMRTIEKGETFVDNGGFAEYAARFPDYQVPQGEMPQSVVAAAVPRPSNRGTFELISLQDVDGERTFSDSDIRLVETLASSMAVALENARLFDETQRLLKETEQRAAELQIINSVQEGLASKLDMEEIYDLVGDNIREIFNADTTFIAFHDVENDLLTSPYYNDKGRRAGPSIRPYGKGLADRIIESGEPLLLNTAQEMKDFGAVEIASPGSDKDLNESFLGVPILREGEAIGATSVQSYQPYAFDENDQTLLQTLTNSMSVALENAELFDQTQRLLQETEQRAAELATINAVGQALVAETELDALIELIGEQVRQTFEANIVYVAILDASGGVIQFPYSYGENFEPLQLGEGLTSKILETGEPLLINEEMDRRRAELGVEQVGKRALSYLGVPIQMGGQTFGVISVQSTREEGRFNEADLHLLNTIAANVGTAIRNAQLFDEIKRQKQYYQAVIENSPAAIVLLDSDATVTGWNPAAERLFGYQQAEAVGRNIDSLVATHEDIHGEAVDYSQRVMQEKEISRLTRRTRKDGSFVEVDLAGVPVSVDGEYVGFIAIYHDVTELQQARREAEQANKAKSTFLANMSHELRTPLNAIIGFTRIVRRKGEEVLPEQQVENLDKVLVSADHLLELINTVLDISKIEAGRMDVNPTSFELQPMLDVVLATSQPLLQPGVELTVEIADKLPELYSDQEKIRQILINLLSNAAKFTPQGEIRLRAHEQGGLIQIDVSDTGIGIASEELESIFEEFQQADTSTTREYGGTGLGLAISRSLARLLGGDLTASSVEGRGSTFSLKIPMEYGRRTSRAQPPSEGAEEAASRPDQLLVLAIDDDPHVHELLEENLADDGYHVVGATSGKKGLKLARRLQPFAITLDIMMPHKDGWQVLHELKSDPKTRHIPVILLTVVDKRSLGFQLGADHYLVKPLDEEQVRAALEQLRPRRDSEAPGRVLVVDDDPNIAEWVGQLLERDNYQLEAASNGQQALDLIRSRPPDVILLDLMMPLMDGFELIEALRAEGREIPIIVLTAKDLTDDNLDRLEGSVEQILQKNGTDQDELLAELRRTIEGLDTGKVAQEG